MSYDREHSVWLLRTETTWEQWFVELQLVIEGARNDAIVHFGSAGAYVRSLIFNSRDDAVATTCFLKALLRLLAFWHPLDHPNAGGDPRNLRILQLLAAYTPSEGMAQTLVLLRHMNRPGPRPSDSTARRVKSLALQVMERYFPLEQGPAGAFAEYIEQLEINLAEPDYALYAAKRLRELRKLRVTPDISRLIERDAEILPKIISIFVPSPTPRSEDSTLLIELYTCCLRASNSSDALALYRATIRSLGFKLIPGAKPRLEPSNGKQTDSSVEKSDYDFLLNTRPQDLKVLTERIEREVRSEKPAVPANHRSKLGHSRSLLWGRVGGRQERRRHD